MIKYVNPPFIHTGMLVWIETDHPRQKGIYIVCEIQSIEKKTAEVCDLSSRTCFWVPHSELRVKVMGHPQVTILPESKFHEIIICRK